MYRGLLGTPETVDPGRRRAGYLSSTSLFIPAYALVDPNGDEISNENYLPTAATQRIVEAGFSDVSATDIIDPVFSTANGGSVKVKGSMTDSQSSGSAVIVTGTTANSEFLARSGPTFKGAVRVRSHQILSQRIANANFMTLLADLQGEDLAYTINSATSVTVTQTGHTLTAANIGQFMFLGGLSSVGIPGRYAIASVVAGVSITFTVASWPASGSGTLTLFGRNHVRVLFDGTSQTSGSWNNQRNGWEAGATATTINTTASPGTVLVLETTGTDALFYDTLLAAATLPNLTLRSSRIHALPPADLPLYLFLWAYNGNTAPASSTTWTIGHARVEENAMQSVYLQGVRPNGNANALPTTIVGSPSVGLNAGTNLAGDVGIQFRASATGAGTVINVASPATPAGTLIKSGAGRLLAINLCNTSTGVRWVKFFNATSVTPGTTAAAFERPIAVGGSLELAFDGGLGFSTGMMIMVTAARGLTDNTATGLALGDVSGFTVHA
jgi:hypothetical protein